MKARKNLMSALLGAALLAMPITAAAHPRDGGHNRGPAPAYHQMPAFRPAVAPRANFRADVAPRVAANNRMWMAPRTPIVPIHDHDDWRWRDRDGDGWRQHERNEWRWRNQFRNNEWRERRENYPYRTLCDEDGDDCRQVPRANNYYYRQGYRPNYYQPDSYDYSTPQYNGAPYAGGPANLIRERDNAQFLYQQALRRGDRVGAKHLRNDIVELNKRIGSVGGGGYGYSGYSAYNNPYASNYANGYGYGNANGYGYGNGYANNGLDSIIGPLLGNFTP